MIVVSVPIIGQGAPAAPFSDDFNRSNRNLNGDNGWELATQLGTMAIVDNEALVTSFDGPDSTGHYLLNAYDAVGIWRTSAVHEVSVDARLFSLAAFPPNGNGILSLFVAAEWGEQTVTDPGYDPYTSEWGRGVAWEIRDDGRLEIYSFTDPMPEYFGPGENDWYWSYGQFYYGRTTVAAASLMNKPLGTKINYRLTYDPATRMARGYADGVEVISQEIPANQIHMGTHSGFSITKNRDVTLGAPIDQPEVSFTKTLTFVQEAEEGVPQNTPGTYQATVTFTGQASDPDTRSTVPGLIHFRDDIPYEVTLDAIQIHPAHDYSGDPSVGFEGLRYFRVGKTPIDIAVGQTISVPATSGSDYAYIEYSWGHLEGTGGVILGGERDYYGEQVVSMTAPYRQPMTGVIREHVVDNFNVTETTISIFDDFNRANGATPGVLGDTSDGKATWETRSYDPGFGFRVLNNKAFAYSGTDYQVVDALGTAPGVVSGILGRESGIAQGMLGLIYSYTGSYFDGDDECYWVSIYSSGDFVAVGKKIAGGEETLGSYFNEGIGIQGNRFGLTVDPDTHDVLLYVNGVLVRTIPDTSGSYPPASSLHGIRSGGAGQTFYWVDDWRFDVL